MPEVIAGILSVADIAVHAITQGEVYVASQSGGTWSPNVWVDLPVTITVPDVPEGAKALCLFQSSMRADYAGHVFYLRCVVDDAPQLESTMTTESSGTGQYMPAACCAFVTGLSAGTHTFKVQAMCDNSVTNSYWSALRHIVAIMKR
ncbi:MAG: hypothetical protein ACM3X3_11680 [Betaproteobacteria bacterium]